MEVVVDDDDEYPDISSNLASNLTSLDSNFLLAVDTSERIFFRISACVCVCVCVGGGGGGGGGGELHQLLLTVVRY